MYLLAGMAIGAVGMAVAKEAKEGNGGPGLKAVVQGGHNIVEKVMGTAETIKEDVEDYLAEAKFLREEKTAEQAVAGDVEVEVTEDPVAEKAVAEEPVVEAAPVVEEKVVEKKKK